MKSKAEVKFTGDEYAGFYSCGLTMLGNSSMRRFTQASENDGEYQTVSEDGLALNVTTVKSPYSDAYEVQTTIRNSELSSARQMLADRSADTGSSS